MTTACGAVNGEVLACRRQCAERGCLAEPARELIAAVVVSFHLIPFYLFKKHGKRRN